MSSIHQTVSEKLRLSYSDYFLLADNDKTYEILDRELLTGSLTSTKHQIVLLNLAISLSTFVEKNESGRVLITPIDLVLSKCEVVQPDIIFISTKNKQIIKSTHIEGVPDLVIEIISPGSAQRDRIIKRKIYTLHGVKEYWLVQPEKEQIQVLRLEKGDFQSIAELTSEEILTLPLLSGLEIRLIDVFPK